MKLRLLDYLACTHCGGTLTCTINNADATLPWTEVIEGTLDCTRCLAKFAIRSGVPRLMGDAQLAEETANTVDGFGWEWQTFDKKIQNTYMVEEANFLDFIYPVDEEFFAGKTVLDAGCGMGRFLGLGAEWGSKDIIGVDLSHSVEAAYRNTRAFPNAHVVQADIMCMPFVAQFDYVFSVGVLHHLHDPKAGFAQLVRLLKEGGRISVWVYGEENNGWVIRLVSPLRERVTSKLPRPVLYRLSQFLGLPLYTALRLIYRPVNEAHFLQPLKHLLPYNDYLYYTSRLNFTALVSVVFDHLVPELAAYISRGELDSWFRAADLNEVEISSRNNMSWRGHGYVRRRGKSRGKLDPVYGPQGC